MRKPVVLFAGFMNSFLGTSLGYSAGIIHLGLLEKYKEFPKEVSWAGALFTSFFSLAGIGQSMMFSGTVVVTGYYFIDNPSLATGIIATGAGIGVTVYPLFTEFLIQTYGINGTFLLLSAVNLQTCVFTMCIKTTELEKKRKGERSETISEQLKWILQEFKRIISNSAFCCFCVSILCWSISINTSVLYLPEYYVSTGSTQAQAATFMSIYGITGCLSRILTGLAATDFNVDGKILYMGCFLILGLSTIFLPLIGTSFPGKVFYSVMLGLYSSGVWSLLSPITIEIIGIKQMSTAFGMEMLTCGIGFLIGPVIGDGVKRGKGGYSILFIISGILYIMAAVFEMLMIPRMNRPAFYHARQDETKFIEMEEKIKRNKLIENPSKKESLWGSFDDIEPQEQLHLNDGINC
ncbi:monocarboxylate transporter 6-like isoform X2 [Saccostrea echinata]|uniref:monocarboxylate transporter 6-like isoform X2 n=1 Tax=Saccostrea echinata TaxID=191078 RepID=UPI002A8223FB|nr:monocarboxylate transporter 6-like isoform X2 [Saccostrea echinata]